MDDKNELIEFFRQAKKFIKLNYFAEKNNICVSNLYDAIGKNERRLNKSKLQLIKNDILDELQTFIDEYREDN